MPTLLETEPRISDYCVRSFCEASDTNAAVRAQVIQAESYVAAGYLTRHAVEPNGTLHPDIDTARGVNVTYFLASPRTERRDVTGEAAGRLVGVPDGSGVEALRAYRASWEYLAPAWRERIDLHFEVHGAASVREVAGLSRTRDARPAAVYELLRRMWHEAMMLGTPQLWLATLVDAVCVSIASNFGDRALARVGRVVPAYRVDAWAAREVKFVPVVIEPMLVLDQMAWSLLCDPDPERRRRIHRMAKFLTDGLPEARVPDSLRVALVGLGHARDHRS